MSRWLAFHDLQNMSNVGDQAQSCVLFFRVYLLRKPNLQK